MTKRDLVVRISEKTKLVQQEVFDVVQLTLDYIAAEVALGRTVELRNFGVFEVKIRKARVGRNPNQPMRDVPIPARAVVKFKPGKEMREAVLRLTPQAMPQPPSPPPVPAPAAAPAPTLTPTPLKAGSSGKASAAGRGATAKSSAKATGTGGG